MKEQKLVYTEKSAKPSLIKILCWLLAGDFLACILYGIAMGAGGSIDKQMENAPAFLIELAVITTVLTILFYRLSGKRNTSISIYERTVIFSAPKVPMLAEDDSTAVPVPAPASASAENASEPESAEKTEDDPFGGDAEAPAKRENPYLKKNRQKKEPSKEAKAPEKPRLSNISWDGDEEIGDSRKKIGKVTHDIPNSEVECPIEQLHSASRKGKNVTLIMKNGDRYLFVRMAGAARLVRVIEDKVAAEIQVN